MKQEKLGSVIGLFVSKDEEPKRQKKEHLHVDLDGIEGDKFKGKDIERSVLLVSQYSYQLTNESGIELSSGELGENILLDFNPYSLGSGEQIQIGDVVLEIAQKSSLCPSLSKISSKLPKLLKDKRGMFAKIIKSGVLSDGDKVYLIAK